MSVHLVRIKEVFARPPSSSLGIHYLIPLFDLASSWCRHVECHIGAAPDTQARMTGLEQSRRLVLRHDSSLLSNSVIWSWCLNLFSGHLFASGGKHMHLLGFLRGFKEMIVGILGLCLAHTEYSITDGCWEQGWYLLFCFLFFF